MSPSVIGLPAGYRDVLRVEARARRALESRCADVLEKSGYGEISPSAIEFLDVYALGDQSAKSVAFKFLDRDDQLLALRADYTPAIARMAASGSLGETLPFKVWYCGNVFRKADLNRGRFHEFRQIGAELLGANSIAQDIEIINLAMRCLAASGITGVQLHLNHAGVFKGLVDSLDLAPGELTLLKTELDRKDVRGVAARLQSLGVALKLQEQVHMLSRAAGDASILRGARDAMQNDVSRTAIEHLLELADALGEWKQSLVFDLTEIDDREYYTGVIFKFFSPKSTGELGGGGRYDSLLDAFGRAMPAVGFSFSVDRLVELS